MSPSVPRRLHPPTGSLVTLPRTLGNPFRHELGIQAGTDHHTIEVMNLDGSGRAVLRTGSPGDYVDGLAWGAVQ
jgi:hypothetical protein